MPTTRETLAPWRRRPKYVPSKPVATQQVFIEGWLGVFFGNSQLCGFKGSNVGVQWHPQ